MLQQNLSKYYIFKIMYGTSYNHPNIVIWANDGYCQKKCCLEQERNLVYTLNFNFGDIY